jgi:hypothetical protein
VNRLARAPELISKALDRGHARLALAALSYISNEHRGPVLQSVTRQLSLVFPAVMAGLAKLNHDSGRRQHGRRRVVLASEPFLQRLLQLHRAYYVSVVRPVEDRSACKKMIAESAPLNEMIAAGVPTDISELGALVPAWAVEARRLGRLQEVALDPELQASLTTELLLRGEV